MMQLNGWGRYPSQDANVVLPMSAAECSAAVQSGEPVIARGLGRSYGDSSLAPRVLSTRYLDHFESFDPDHGLLTCAAGVSLDAILNTFVPRGWFLPVTPGTRFVTVGGAIASDVHGKNHHRDGTFCAHVERIEILLGNGERVTASPTTNRDLFHATCAGMGLTGIVLSATVRLRRITSSDMLTTTFKAPSLDAVLEGLRAYGASTYSVAWIDCLARGRSLGRSLLFLGEHAADGPLVLQRRSTRRLPVDLPAGLLNRVTAQAFNGWYYGRIQRGQTTGRVPFEAFFYPLDAIGEWNRAYGKPGFLQYQFVLPVAAGTAGLREVLSRIAESGRASCLAVLKVFGAQNENMLSFPTGGYTLALDFRAEPAVFELLDTLDRIVLEHGGRVYLAKDARMSEPTFKAGYPRWQEFESTRARWHAHGHFSSRQSRRLGLL